MSAVDTIEAIAREFHRMYERMSSRVGWETQESTRVEFDDLPEANRALMLDVVCNLLERGVIAPGKRLNVPERCGCGRRYSEPADYFCYDAGDHRG